MAGAPVGGGGGGSHRKKKGKRKPKRRMAIHIDMTPMVDIAFLLLTFFMLTTVFRKPQTLEINLPPGSAKVEIAESNLLTIRVDEKENIFWNIGIETPVKIEEKDFQKFLIQKNQENPKFVVLVKIDRKARYVKMVDILDQLNIASMTRFSIAPMTDIDLKILAKAQGA